jgi:hypothetical protein
MSGGDYAGARRLESGVRGLTKAAVDSVARWRRCRDGNACTDAGASCGTVDAVFEVQR